MAALVLHQGAMNIRVATASLALWVFLGACGGAQSEPASASNPSPETAASSDAGASSAAPAPMESAAPAPVASAAPTASEPPPPPAPPGPGDWTTWSHEQKLAYMKATVMPKMAGVFHDFDAKTYAEPKCVLCHGSGVADGTFTMPSPDLPKLDPSPAGMKKLHAKKGPIVAFMGKEVVPTIASLLGEAPFDMKTHQGFGCFNCHTKTDAKTDAGPAGKKAPGAAEPAMKGTPAPAKSSK